MGRESGSVFTTAERMNLEADTEGLYGRLDRQSPDESASRVDELDAWYDAVPGGDDQFFRRLELAGVSVAEARRRLSGNTEPDRQPSDWIDIASDLVKYLMLVDDDGENADGSRPFSDVITHVADYAWNQVDWSSYPLVGPAGARAAKSTIHDRLEHLLTNPLYAWYEAFRRSKDDTGSEAGNGGDGANPLYDEYVSYLKEGGFKAFLMAYPVAARLTVEVIANWTVATEEFLQRLHDDRSELTELVSGVTEDGVTGIESVGDPHEAGRQTLLVETEDGDKVVYKPRSVAPAIAYNRLLGWVNEDSDLPEFKRVSVVEKEDYGWMEWVEREQCRSIEEVELFYRRAGSLLALLYAFRFIDGNIENVVAHGSQPVVIDLETTADPGAAVRPPATKGKSLLEESVLRTSLLPREMNVPDMSGLSREEVEIFMEDEVTYENVNADDMELAFGATATVKGKSLPRLDGRIMYPDDYVDEIRAGFEHAYEYVLDNRADLLAETGPLRWFDDLECRCIFRSTITYMRMIKTLRRPEQLQDGFDFDLKLERLTKPFVEDRLEEEFWPVFHAEKEALHGQNVPRFTVRTGETSVYHSGEPIAEDVLPESPLQQIRQQIRSLDRRDLSEQLDYIHSAYDPTSFNRFEERNHGVDSRPDDFPGAGGGAYRRAAIETAEDVLSSRRSDGDSSSWILRRKYQGEGLDVMNARPGLYEGRLGIAVALAGVAEAVESDFYADVAEDVALNAIEDRPDDPDEYRVLGGARGLGGDLYALTRVGSLTGSQACIDSAVALVEDLSTARIRDTGHRDVFRGSAGLVLGAGTVHDLTGSDAALERALVAGEQLTDVVVESGEGPRWRTMSTEQVYSGFVHGTAGIAYSLAYLGDVSGESRYRDVAIDALATVPTEHDAIRVPDGNEDDTTGLKEGWANGVTGIGLGLVGAYGITGHDALRRRIEESLASVDSGRPLPSFELHRGRAGRVEWFNEANEVVDGYGLADRIEGNLHSVVRYRRESPGRVSYRVPWHTSHWTNPALFNGIGGLAYTFARMLEPTLPNVLLWE